MDVDFEVPGNLTLVVICHFLVKTLGYKLDCPKEINQLFFENSNFFVALKILISKHRPATKNGLTTFFVKINPYLT